MPCKECENGKWRWGESGECMYESLSDCEEANVDYYLDEQFIPQPEAVADFTLNFTKSQMKDLHENGELLVEVERDDAETMTILFTYDAETDDDDRDEDEDADVELDEQYAKLTKSMLDDELDEYIDKITESIKKL
jgi:hypothetical protein